MRAPCIPILARAATLALPIALCVASLAPAASAQDEVAPLSIAFASDISTFDPAIGYDALSFPVEHALYDTLVTDRARLRPRGAAARALRAIDRRAFRRADLVVADTAAHASFFRTAFGLPYGRVRVCFVGAEDRLFQPLWQPPASFHALFVGKLIPLHGIETILAAAALAPEIPFRIVGSGQLEQVLAARPTNVTWTPWVEYGQLPRELQRAGCALGIFGSGAKTGRVIPNKAFQALACGTPLVTADTPAARELLCDGVDALLVPAGDAGALAAAVRQLAADTALATRIGRQGRATYEARASEPVLGRQWRTLLEQIVAGT